MWRMGLEVQMEGEALEMRLFLCQAQAYQQWLLRRIWCYYFFHRASFFPNNCTVSCKGLRQLYTGMYYQVKTIRLDYMYNSLVIVYSYFLIPRYFFNHELGLAPPTLVDFRWVFTFLALGMQLSAQCICSTLATIH